jgi:hypothetical protein
MSSNYKDALAADLERISQLPLEEQLAEFARIRESLEGVLSGTISAEDIGSESREQVN